MRFKCSICGERFDDGEEYARHVEAEHKDESTLGVQTAEAIRTKDKFG